ncbi:MAG TPA: hypothetical protein VJV78_39380 [Polyangiales bacterium]|nr:hypothetical protein [Polyangiales bacterium]
MPQPAPERFTESDRRTLSVSFWTALGPFVTMAALVVGYALSARSCQWPARVWIAVTLGCAGAGCGAASFALSRLRGSAPAPALAAQRLLLGAQSLQMFCLLVVIAFAIALGVRVTCG